MEKQVPARARIFSMNIPALRRDKKEAERDLKPAGREGEVGHRGGQKLGQVQIRKAKQHKQ